MEKSHADKVVHVVEYTFFGFLLARALSRHSFFWRSTQRVFWVVVLLGALYGASDEFHQRFVPERDCSVYDLAADATGVVIGCLLWIQKKKKKKNNGRT